MACLGAQILVSIALRLCNDRLNKRNKRIREEMGEEEAAMLREKLAYADETDRKNPFFLYTH